MNMVKRLLAFDLAILIFIMSVFVPLGFAASMPTQPASLPLSIVDISPPFPYEGVRNLPGIGEIAFAEPIIEHFMGLDWQIDDAFYVDVLYRYGTIVIQFDHSHYDYDYIAIVMNQFHIYYMTPIIIDDYMVFDFTNVEPGKYKIYLIQNLPFEDD